MPLQHRTHVEEILSVVFDIFDPVKWVSTIEQFLVIIVIYQIVLKVLAVDDWYRYYMENKW